MSNERKVAVVTGASRGLGEGIAKAYLDRGYQVVGTSRSIKPSNNPDYVTIAGDIGDPAVGKAVIDSAVARFGRVDTLINNAGIFIPSPFTQYTPEQYRALLATNLDGFFFTTQAAAEVMLKQGSGHIVQITTTIVDHALSAVPSVLASLTKGALSAATKSLAIEYAKQGIRVNAVAPGITETEIHALSTGEAGRVARIAPLIPLKRAATAGEIAEAVLFLLSEASSYTTGIILKVGGGR